VLSVVVYLMSRPPRRPLPRGIAPTGASPQLAFEYELVCPRERTIDLAEVRRCPALAPLASLTPGVAAADLPALTDAVEHGGLPRPEASDLLAITYVVAGCRFPRHMQGRRHRASRPA
jgi:hypothetical protein